MDKKGNAIRPKSQSLWVYIVPNHLVYHRVQAIGLIGVLRSQLITGAMAAVSSIVKRPAKTKKEAWVQSLVERKGKKCATIALANKTVRTAYAMLSQGSEYKAELLTAE